MPDAVMPVHADPMPARRHLVPRTPSPPSEARASDARRQVLVTGLVAILALREALALVAPALGGDVAFTLRPDDFWSYESGFGRRALVGSALHALGLVAGGRAPWLLSAALVVGYALVVHRVLPVVTARLGGVAVGLLALTPLVTSFHVDREVVLALPALLLARGSGTNATRLAALAAVPVAALVLETTLLLYLPLLALLARDAAAPVLRRGAGVALLATLAVVAASAWPGGPPPTLRLERDFWPALGIVGLERHELYAFATRGLGEVLALHLRVLRTREGLASCLFVATMLGFLTCGLGAGARRRAWLLAGVPLLCVLTIDHGRYAWILLAFTVLADAALVACGAVAPSGAPGPAPPPSPVALALVAALAALPVGFWAGARGEPAPVRLALEFLEGPRVPWEHGNRPPAEAP